MNRKSSTFQIVLLSVFGALGVAAVLIFALATAGGGSGGISPVTIWGTLDANTMKDVLHAASEQDSRLDNVTYVQKDPTTFESDLANALASGTGPDLILTRSDESFYDANKLYTIPYSALSQAQFTSTFVPAADPFLASSGILGVPLLVDPLVLYWNTDMLATAGLAQPPQTWDQMPGDVQEIVQKDNAGNLQKEGIALGTYANIDAAKDILSMMIEQAGGQITTTNSSGQIVPALSQGGSASSAATQSLTFYTGFANPSQSYYTWNDAQSNAQQAFAAGTLAMYIGYASEYSQIVATNPNLTFSTAPVPQIKGTANSVDEGITYALSIPKNDPNLQSALTVAFLIASEPVEQALSSAYGLAPARRDAITASEQATSTATGNLPLYGKMALITQSWLDPDPSQTGPIFQSMIENTENGSSEASDAIGQANQQIANILQKMQPQSQ